MAQQGAEQLHRVLPLQEAHALGLQLGIQGAHPAGGLHDLVDDGLGPSLLAAQLDLRVGGDVLLLQGHVVDALQVIVDPDLSGADEADGGALVPGAAGAAGPVNVHLGGVRQHVVDDVAELADVDAAGGDVRGHEEAQILGLHPAHDPLPLFLGQIAVQVLCVVPLALEVVRHHLRVRSGVGEDQRAVGILVLYHLHEIRGATHPGDHVVVVLHLIRGDVLLHHGEELGLLHVALGVPLDVLGDGGREQQRLPRLGHVPHDLVQLTGEAHGEHLVGLVEHEGLKIAQIQGAAAQVIEHPPWGAHHGVGELDLRHLLFHGGPAVDRGGVEPLVLRQLGELLRYLAGELTGGAERQDLHALRLVPEVLDHGDAKGSGLAGPGLGLHHQIAAGADEGDGVRLDGGRVLIAHLVEGGEHAL